MPVFGRRGGGGRRSSPRSLTPIDVVVWTRTSTYRASVEDLSCTGIGLRGESLPPKWSEASLSLEGIKLFGTVVWSARDACGISFDEPLLKGEFLRIEKTLGAGVAPGAISERMARMDWETGFAR